MPKVSVAMPLYNAEKYLAEALESVLSQEGCDFELIIVDNCSTDGTVEIVRSFQQRTPKIRFFQNETNIGYCGNINRCVEVSTGDYLNIFHGDDLLAPGSLAWRAAIFDAHPRVDLVFTAFDMIDGAGRLTGRRGLLAQDHMENGRLFLRRFPAEIVINPFCCPHIMVRRNVYDRIPTFNLELPYGGGYDMWLRTILQGDVYYSSKVVGAYRQHASNGGQAFPQSARVREKSIILSPIVDGLELDPVEKEIYLDTMIAEVIRYHLFPCRDNPQEVAAIASILDSWPGWKPKTSVVFKALTEPAQRR